MCYRPITISNPKLCKNHVYDRSLIEVPCGKCEDCKDIKRLSWFVRLFYEWKYALSQGGFALYETFTYSEDNVPKMFDNFEFPELLKYGCRYSKGIRCFSKRDLQLYLKKVRKHLSTYYPNIDFRGKFKYFITMEFGGKTHRPHYHCIFFCLTNEINVYDFKDIIEKKWEKGHVEPGSINNGIVCDVGGLSYCAKYVCKDIYEDAWFRIIEDRLKKIGLKREEYDCCFPHHLQSSGLGLYALQCDELNDLQTFMDGSINLPDKKDCVRSYKLPLYFERKLFYTVKYRYFDNEKGEYVICDSYRDVPVAYSASPVYILNELGLEMKDFRFQKVINSVTNVYNLSLSIPENEEYINKINHEFKTNFVSLKELQRSIKSVVSEEAFVFYSLVYRGCVSSGNSYLPSLRNLDARKDYNLIQSMESGFAPLSVDYNDFLYNIDVVNSIPYIEDFYCIVRFLFKLIHLDKEKFVNEREKDYVEQKSIHLLQKDRMFNIY